MRQDERTPFANALLRARTGAYPPGEFIGQESFMLASEIRQLAERAGIGPGVRVLDLCCGMAGPGRMITAELDCDYLGLDSSVDALNIARDLAAGLPCRFEQAVVPALPSGRFEVVLLLETMLAFADKPALVAAVDRALLPGGRFAFTVEEGAPLTSGERAEMPDSDTVWPIEPADLHVLMRAHGLVTAWHRECTAEHLAAATAILAAMRADANAIADGIGQRAFADLVAAHRLWCDWLADGRVRKFAVVARKVVPS